MFNINMVGHTPRELSSFLQHIKGNLALQMPDVYSITCKCGRVYIGQTGHSLQTRVKEHHSLIYLNHPEKYMVPNTAPTSAIG
jgi:predicted GIY-YIG superfamily endonuclease